MVFSAVKGWEGVSREGSRVKEGGRVRRVMLGGRVYSQPFYS
jgi:hypothetical protein